MHPGLRFILHRRVILAVLHRPIHLRFIKYVLKIGYNINIVGLLKTFFGQKIIILKSTNVGIFGNSHSSNLDGNHQIFLHLYFQNI